MLWAKAAAITEAAEIRVVISRPLKGVRVVFLRP
jgi:hypothetical protein